MKTINKKTILGACIFLALLGAVILILEVVVVRPKQKAIEDRFTAFTEEHTENKLKLNYGVNPDMYNADYWISLRENDGIDTAQMLMTPDRAEYINYKNRRLISSNNINMALDEIGEVFNGEVAGKIIKDTYSYSDELLNLEAIPRGIETKFGFSTIHTCLRKCPTDESSYEDDILYYDEMVQSDLRPFSPVIVIHESADKEWFYVLTYGYGGWIRKEYVALCNSRDEWVSLMNFSEYLVVTGCEIRIESDPYYGELQEMLIPMGTRLPLATDEEIKDFLDKDKFHGRVPYGNYIVKVPIRLEDGSVGSEFVSIPISYDVSVGYLEYTEANVAKQVLKYSGRLYGWGNANNSCDCSGMTQNVYACFGINLSRGAETQLNTLDVEIINTEKKSIEEKKSILKEVPIGTLLYFPGHIMIYLGLEQGVPYCISSVGDISTKELGAGNVVSVNSVIISNMIDTARKSGKSWLDSVEKIAVIR